MKITILIDNNTLQEDLVTEMGFSAFIEEADKNILYDTGRAGNLIGNAMKLGVDLLKTDIIAISHGHYDHTDGLKSLIAFFKENKDNRKRSLVIHPNGFIDRWNSVKNRYIGSELKEADLQEHFDIHFSVGPVSLTDKLTWSGEIERTNDFECKNMNFHTKDGDDKIEDDTALFYKSEKGLVIIAGCSHSGICNIIKHAKKSEKDDRILDIVGGIHLKDASTDLIEKTMSEVEKTNPQEVHFCHCTGEKAFSFLQETRTMNFHPIGCGWSKEYF